MLKLTLMTLDRTAKKVGRKLKARRWRLRPVMLVFDDADSRQARRQVERIEKKDTHGEAKATIRRHRSRRLLQRQSEREKAGFYEGRPSVASCLGQTRARRMRQLKSDGTRRRPGNLVRLL